MPMLWNKDKLCEESERESPQNRAAICLVKTDTPPRLKIAFPHLNRRILSICAIKWKIVNYTSNKDEDAKLL